MIAHASNVVREALKETAMTALERPSAGISHRQRDMTEKPDNLALHLLREIRGELTEMKLSMKQLANTQASLLQLTSTQENRLLRIETDISIIKKRIDLIEARLGRS